MKKFTPLIFFGCFVMLVVGIGIWGTKSESKWAIIILGAAIIVSSIMTGVIVFGKGKKMRAQPYWKERIAIFIFQSNQSIPLFETALQEELEINRGASIVRCFAYSTLNEVFKNREKNGWNMIVTGELKQLRKTPKYALNMTVKINSRDRPVWEYTGECQISADSSPLCQKEVFTDFAGQILDLYNEDMKKKDAKPHVGENLPVTA